MRAHGRRARCSTASAISYSREVFVHGRDVWDAERVVAFALSLGQVSRRLVEGESEEQVVGELREALGGRRLPVWWSYDVVVGSRA